MRQKNTSKARLDTIFSEYIRRRDSDDRGFVKCISCGKILHWKDSDCGHYINRKHNSTRYDEMNCNAQCRSCNRFDEGNMQGYRKGLISKFGEKEVEMLEIKKFNACRLDRTEINILADVYRKKLKDLKQEKKI
jgi:hypothetical protein